MRMTPSFRGRRAALDEDRFTGSQELEAAILRDVEAALAEADALEEAEREVLQPSSHIANGQGRAVGSRMRSLVKH